MIVNISITNDVKTAIYVAYNTIDFLLWYSKILFLITDFSYKYYAHESGVLSTVQMGEFVTVKLGIL